MHCELQLVSVTSRNLNGNLSSKPFPGRKLVILCHAVPSKKGANLKDMAVSRAREMPTLPLGTSQCPCGCSMMVDLKRALPPKSSEV